ncbi:MAG TPA: hypothetical protein VMX17_16075 [Candidatus Glassbacteria bacterium]|nr:hypothetical protein [Candidatus Glassbacteria bacterium]
MKKTTFLEGLDDSWTRNGKTVTLRKLLEITKDIPIQKIPISKLSSLALHSNNPDEQENIEKSDLNYPVLIFVNDDNSVNFIVDGHHRVQKAIKHEIPTIGAKLIKLNDLPEDFQEVFGLKHINEAEEKIKRIRDLNKKINL